MSRIYRHRHFDVDVTVAGMKVYVGGEVLGKFESDVAIASAKVPA